MAVPLTGPLGLRKDINLEVNGNVTDENVKLHQLSISAGFSTPDAMSDFYGYSSVVSPSVSTSSNTSLGCTSIVLNGNVTDTGGENVTRGFYFGTNSAASSNNTKYSLAGTQGTGTFSCTKTGLSYNTAYYTWAFACNSAGEAVGGRADATTSFPPYSPTLVSDNRSSNSKMEYLNAGGTAAPGAQINSYTQLGYINPYNGGYTAQCSCSKNWSWYQSSDNPAGTSCIQCNFIQSVCGASGIMNFHRGCTFSYFPGAPSAPYGHTICSSYYSQSPLGNRTSPVCAVELNVYSTGRGAAAAHLNCYSILHSTNSCDCLRTMQVMCSGQTGDQFFICNNFNVCWCRCSSDIRLKNNINYL